MKKLTRIAGWSLAAALLPLAGFAQQKPLEPNAPAAKAAPAAPANPFPATNPKFFTATTPTVDTVNSFLKQLWGFDTNRQWQVAAILATPAPGVAKIVVFIADKNQPGKTQQAVFFTTPDGNHAISDNVVSFGAQPFAEKSKLMQERADGPARGAAGKGLLLVEFADLQCPHCADAQTTMDQLVADFPQARVVFQNDPLTEIHPWAEQAAAQGVCLRKSKGDAAFFKYAQAVFTMQGALTEADGAQTLANAVEKAGGDAKAVFACSKTPATEAEVKASVKLAQDAGVESTPTLVVNGFALPLGSIPYETLKKIIVYRANQDGIPVKDQPSLSTLK